MPASGNQWRLSSRQHEPHWYVLSPLWRNLYGPTYGALRAPQRTPCRRRSDGSVLKNESGWRGMPGFWYGPKFPNVDPQPGREVDDVRAFGGRRITPVIAGVNLHQIRWWDFKSFHALRIPNKTKGRASSQCSSVWHIRADFSADGVASRSRHLRRDATQKFGLERIRLW